ncbi:hypothetical protein [Actinomadura rifamycini]|uniref:hypothetical protein n=1 Tax=Actinomadura rifamycini TaxID=31962 RepID=UPI0003F6A21E|nr:hypothetical protein [Actinomadura rifamycini]
MTTATSAGAGARTLPERFADLERWVADWARPTRQERYDMRLSKKYDELEEFYDAIAPRAEEAVEYLNGRDLDDLADDDARLLQLLYSMILVSYAVNVFMQPRIPDSGAAFFDTTAEPAV